MKYWLLLPLLFYFFFFVTTPVHAADFLFDYQVYYTVATNGKTHVKQDITLTNKVTSYFASNFTLTVFSERIESIKARDPEGNITPEINQANGQTIITLPFNVKSVGMGNQFTFTLEYYASDIAEKKGQIWDLLIPGIEKGEEINSYTVHVNTPSSFGKPDYVSPLPNSDGVWTLNQLKGGGIALTYGSVQQYTFNLIYYLENPGKKDLIQEITLPPDTAFQKVILNRLSITPKEVRLDTDGNWLAEFYLKPGEKKKIFAEGSILVFNEPLPEFKTQLTASQKLLYTRSQPLWEQTPEIKAKGGELKTPRAIYDWVVNTLVYDYSRVVNGIKRLGAPAAFANPQSAVCMEFSDLYIALARSAGIPTREVHGFAYTTNSRIQPLSLVSDVLHAWVEYFDAEKQIWVPIDPTWGNTTRGIDYFSKFDLNHIVFAILGEKSDYPFPAGSFKGSTDSKDVYVDFTKETITMPPPNFEISFSVPKQSLVGGTVKGTLHIKNTGNVLYRPKSLKLTSIYPVTFDASLLKPIPPYGESDIPFSISSAFGWKSNSLKLTANLDQKTVYSEILLQPFYQAFLLPFISLIGVIVVFFVILKLHAKRT